jgi:hypothetical protein
MTTKLQHHVPSPRYWHCLISTPLPPEHAARIISPHPAVCLGNFLNGLNGRFPARTASHNRSRLGQQYPPRFLECSSHRQVSQFPADTDDEDQPTRGRGRGTDPTLQRSFRPGRILICSTRLDLTRLDSTFFSKVNHPKPLPRRRHPGRPVRFTSPVISCPQQPSSDQIRARVSKDSAKRSQVEPRVS